MGRHNFKMNQTQVLETSLRLLSANNFYIISVGVLIVTLALIYILYKFITHNERTIQSFESDLLYRSNILLEKIAIQQHRDLSVRSVKNEISIEEPKALSRKTPPKVTWAKDVENF